MSYNLILIDGDGMFFNGELLRQGREGGIEAAKTLKSLVTSGPSSSPSIPTHIRIFANVTELCRLAMYNGLVTTRKQISDFLIGFNDACNEHCFFIDVGYGKEMADHKIKSEIEFHLLHAVGCKSLILGASHDNGYARILKDSRLAEHVKNIWLLEGPPMERELRTLGLPIISSSECKGLWAGMKLQSPPAGWVSSSATTPAAPATVTSPQPEPDQPEPAQPKPSISGSYAGVASKLAQSTPPPSPPVRHALLSQSRPPIKASRAGQTFYEQADYQKIRNLDPKACINYYLRDYCSYGDSCYHEHDYRLNEAELTALRAFVKNVPCNKEECYDAECVYGHPKRNF